MTGEPHEAIATTAARRDTIHTWARLSPIIVVFLLGTVGMMRPKVSSADDTGDAQKNLVIDVQQADWAELATLPGLGETLARRIVMHRMALQADGKSLDSPEQLLDVPGIGPKRLEDISPFLSFGSPSR